MIRSGDGAPGAAGSRTPFPFPSSKARRSPYATFPVPPAAVRSTSALSGGTLGSSYVKSAGRDPLYAASWATKVLVASPPTVLSQVGYQPMARWIGFEIAAAPLVRS